MNSVSDLFAYSSAGTANQSDLAGILNSTDNSPVGTTIQPVVFPAHTMNRSVDFLARMINLLSDFLVDVMIQSDFLAHTLDPSADTWVAEFLTDLKAPARLQSKLQD